MRALKLAVLLLVTSLGGVALAAGEVNGRIVGSVTEAQTRAPVPGAIVTVSSRALIGGARSVTTGDDGRYEVVELPPGSYDVEVSYSGVKPVRRRVFVNQDQATPLDIAWSAELAETETTVIIEERHMTKPDSTQSGTVLASDTESKVAVQHRYQAIIAQAAGVVQPDLGALQFAIKGGSILSNRYLIDGMDLTDPTSNTWSANINFDTMASEEIITGGFEAEYNSLGGVVNLITTGGSDEWHVDTSVYINNTAFTLSSAAGSQYYNGFRPFSTTPPQPTQAYQANINVGGPLVKHRLWFNISGEYLYEERSIAVGPPLNIAHPSYYRHQFLGHLKLTWAPSEKHRVSLTVNTDPAWLHNLDSFSGSAANFERGIAEAYQAQGGAFGVLQWQYFPSQNINTTVQAGYQYSKIDYGPEGLLGNVNYGPGCPNPANPNDPSCNYSANQPRHTNTSDNTIWFQGPVEQLTNYHSVSLDPSISVRGRAAGSHDAKLGLQSRYVYHTNFVHTPGGFAYSDGGGAMTGSAPGQAGLCDELAGMAGHTDANCNQRSSTPDTTQHDQGANIGVFAQDRWKPTKWLTIVPGIRVDYGWTQNTYNQTVSSLWGVGPRLGAIFDLTRDQKTIFAAYYGRSNEVMSLLAAQATDAALSTVQQWNRATQTWDLLQTTGGQGGFIIDKNAKTPHTDEFTASLRREVFANSVATVDYTYKQISNIWDAVEVNQIWDPTGTKVQGYANGSPQQLFLLTTPDRNYRIYQGVDLSIESRPTPSWDIYVAYTLSWLYGPGAEELGNVTGTGVYAGNSAFYNPRQAMFFNGFLPEDHRHNLKIRVAYSWRGLTLGAFLNYITGSPVSKDFFNNLDAGYTNRRSPQGTEPGSPNDTSKWTEFRLPDLMEMDARAQFDFHGLIGAHVILIADLFNVFNLQQPTGVDNTDTATFGTAQGRQKPFRFQIGLRYLY